MGPRIVIDNVKIITSALSQHYNITGHVFGFDFTGTIATIINKFERKIREAIEIQKRPNCLNKEKTAGI